MMSESHVTDCNGVPLESGDTVQLTKDLQPKGSSLKLKRGESLKIRLTDEPHAVECRIGKSTIVILTQFLKKKK